MPKGTAHTAMSTTSPGAPPRATKRFSPIQAQTTMPTMMHSA
jgi:hypothetical protein